MKRFAIAVWEGTGKDGNGVLSTQSTVLDKTQYSYKSRFESGKGTNPEELIAAAHAGCFDMKLNFLLNEAGFTSESIEVKCDIDFQDGKVVSSHLTVKAKIPKIDDAKFQALVEDARVNCPISKLLNTTISAEASLV